MTRNFTGMGNRDYVKPPRPRRILSPEERPVSLSDLQGGAESFTKRGMFDMVLRTKEVRFLLEIVEAAKQYDLAWETYTSIEDKQYAIDAWNTFIDRQNDLRTLIWGGQEAFEAAHNSEPKADSTHLKGNKSQ